MPAFIPALIFAGGFCGFKNSTLDFALQPICNSAIFPPLRESAVFHTLINFGCTVANHVADIIPSTPMPAPLDVICSWSIGYQRNQIGTLVQTVSVPQSPPATAVIYAGAMLQVHQQHIRTGAESHIEQPRIPPDQQTRRGWRRLAVILGYKNADNQL